MNTSQNKLLKIPPPTIKAGTLIVLSQGEYSDYTVFTLLRALQDLDILLLRSEFPGNIDRNMSGFVKWLEERGATQEIDYWEWHFDMGYGATPPMDISDAENILLWDESEIWQRDHATK